MKVKIKIKHEYSEDADAEINVLYIDGHLFDYLIETKSLKKAKLYCNDNPNLKKSIHGDIQKHFLACLSEFIGREVTIQEVNNSIRKGEIEVEKICI